MVVDPPLRDEASNNVDMVYESPYITSPSNLQYHIPIVDDFHEAFADTLHYHYRFQFQDAAVLEGGNIEYGAVEDGEIKNEEPRALFHTMHLFIAHRDELLPSHHHQFLVFVAMLSSDNSNPHLWDLDPS